MKLLFITSNRIGDAVLSTGVLGHLVEKHPGARITIACGPAPAPLFNAVPGLERVIVMRKAPRAAHWRKLWFETAFTMWDLVVDLRSSAISWLVPTKRRLIYRPRNQNNTTNPVHRVRQLAALIGRENAPPPPRLFLTAQARGEATRLLGEGGPMLAVGPTANWVNKQWPAAYFAAAIGRLTAPDGILPGARVAVFGAPSERAAALPVLDSIPESRRIDLVGNIPLDVAAACLGRAAFYLGNDSGLMHMAAAMGTPTLGLFGPSIEFLYGPWGDKAASVRGPRSCADIVMAPDYDYTNPPDDLMSDLEVDKVIAAAEALWARVRP